MGIYYLILNTFVEYLAQHLLIHNIDPVWWTRASNNRVRPRAWFINGAEIHRINALLLVQSVGRVGIGYSKIWYPLRRGRRRRLDNTKRWLQVFKSSWIGNYIDCGHCTCSQSQALPALARTQEMKSFSFQNACSFFFFYMSKRIIFYLTLLNRWKICILGYFDCVSLWLFWFLHKYVTQKIFLQNCC